MTHHSTTENHVPGPERREPAVLRRPLAELRNHPKRMEGLTRRLAHCQEELWRMQHEAVIALDDTISRLGALDRSSLQGAAGRLLAELEGALEEVRRLDYDTHPRPEHLFAIADRLDRLNQVLPTSSEAAGGSPAGTGS